MQTMILIRSALWGALEALGRIELLSASTNEWPTE